MIENAITKCDETERDTLLATQIFLYETLAIFEKHGVPTDGHAYQTVKEAGKYLNGALVREGREKWFDDVRRVRAAITAAIYAPH